MKNKQSVLFFLSIMAAFGSGFAHLDQTSLSIKGGETFTAGTTVAITWRLVVIHNVFERVYYSSDAGKSWTVIDSVKETSSKQMSYQWKVPMMPTKTGRIRIFQTVIAQPDTVTGDYTLVSGNFTITQKTYIVDNRIMSPVNNLGKKSGAIYTLSGRKVEGNAIMVRKHLRVVDMRQP